MSYIVFLSNPWIKLQVRNLSEDQEALYITCQISSTDSHQAIGLAMGEDGDGEHPWYDNSNLEWLLLLLCLRYAWKE
jgi:hypothetical protein